MSGSYRLKFIASGIFVWRTIKIEMFTVCFIVTKERWKIFFFHFVQFFLNLKFIYFNWRLITLQYCIGFAIHQHESTTGVHVFPILNPPPSPYHPSGSSQCTSPKHPVSCIEHIDSMQSLSSYQRYFSQRKAFLSLLAILWNSAF